MRFAYVYFVVKNSKNIFGFFIENIEKPIEFPQKSWYNIEQIEQSKKIEANLRK